MPAALDKTADAHPSMSPSSIIWWCWFQSRLCHTYWLYSYRSIKHSSRWRHKLGLT